jgi:NAD(P)-dependent dehydrogenase (short-subunit alcohol dehydrogenase family)
MIITGRDAERLEAVALRLADDARVDASIVADLHADRDVQSLVERVLKGPGGIDILVNNAGVFPVGPLDALATEDLDACLTVNLRSPILLCRAFASGMAERGWGRIVNIASSSAYAGFANSATYCASKHGLLGFSRALDDELRTRGVRVIAVSPGSIKTAMGRKVPGQTYETFMEPREIAEIVRCTAALDGSVLVNELRLGRMVMG